jgi:hypothetical protein
MRGGGGPLSEAVALVVSRGRGLMVGMSASSWLFVIQ